MCVNFLSQYVARARLLIFGTADYRKFVALKLSHLECDAGQFVHTERRTRVECLLALGYVHMEGVSFDLFQY